VFEVISRQRVFTAQEGAPNAAGDVVVKSRIGKPSLTFDLSIFSPVPIRFFSVRLLTAHDGRQGVILN
jgi:hypothetical protein